MKKVSRFIAKLILAVIGLHILAVVVIWSMNVIYLGNVKNNNVRYLKKNMYEIDVDKPFHLSQYEKLLEDAKTTSLFILGENHGVANVQTVDKNLFLSLNRSVGTRFYIAEMDSILGRQLTEFLSSPQKNQEVLYDIVIEIKKTIPQQAGKELFKKWSEIYDYNRSLADSVKIEVIGIDIDGDDHASVISRDSAMFDNFVSQVKKRQLENEKFYGMFGYAHILQGPIGVRGYRPFAAMAKKSKFEFANQVKSIACYTIDSETYLPENGQFPTPPDERTGMLNSDGPITLVKGIRGLKAVTLPNSITLFQLDGNDTPYAQGQDLAGVKVNFFGSDVLPENPSFSTIEIVQYAILVRNSGAMTPID